MFKLELFKRDSALNILCLGAHSDDIEIGCGGTILRLIEEVKQTKFNWVVFSSDEVRKAEAYDSADNFLKNAQSRSVIVENFRESYFPFNGAIIKDYFESLKACSLDIIFSHYHKDAHQDHRLISHLTWNTFRDHLILEYEIPKYDGDLGNPNFFVHLNDSTSRKKVRYILENYKSQRKKHWFTEDAFLSILRLRGIESNSLSKHAEGFYCPKMVF